MRESRRLLAGVLVLLAGCVWPPGLAAQARSWPSESPPRPLAARDVKFPPYETKTLANGLAVVVVMHHEQPAVSMRLLFGSGSAQDPPARQGVAALVASLLDQGTTTRSAGEIANTIDSVGGQLDTRTGRDLAIAHVVVMKDSFELGMTLLSDVVRNPVFAEAEIERQRQQVLSALKVSDDDPEYVANVVFDRIVYGFHPYGFPGNGTAESVARIRRDDLVDYHRKYFVPNNAILAVVGDVTSDEAFRMVQAVFGDWARKDIAAETTPEPPSPTRRVVIIDMPYAVQTEIRVGHLGVKRKASDYLPLDLTIRILGGEGANRLHRVLRTERGLTYGAEAQMETLKQAGEFAALTNTRSEATPEVLRLIVDEFYRLKRERVNERELADAKAYMSGHFPLTIETPDDIAAQVLNQLFYDLPLDELQTFRRRVDAVGVDDVARVAERYLRPDRLTVVLVGNAAAFANQLAGVGFGKYERIPIDEVDLTRPDLRRTPASAGPSLGAGALDHDGEAEVPDRRPPAGPFVVEEPTAEAILARAVQAKGGLAKLKSIRTVVATAATIVQTPQGAVTSETKTYVEYPSRFRVEATVPGGESIQVYADGAAWVQGPNGVEAVPPDFISRFRAPAERDLISVLVRAAEGKLKIGIPTSPADASEGGARSPLRLQVSGEGFAPVTLFVDPASGLVTEERYTEQGPRGTQHVREVFSDYRVVDGVRVAFRAAVQSGETIFAERTLKDIRFNVPMAPSLFKRPQG